MTVLRAWGLEQPHLLARRWAPGPDARQRSVLALLQSRDGYLWIGTGRGLIRFDGVSFTRLTAANTPGMAGDRISFGALWEDTRGVIWAGTDFSGVLRNDHGHFETLTPKQGLPDMRVLRIDGDETGAVWIYTLTGVSRWRDGRLEQVHPDQDSSGRTSSIPFSHRGPIDFYKTGLWRRGSSGLERFSYGHWATFPTPPGEAKPFEDDLDSIFEDPSRRVWYSVLSQPGRVFCAGAHGLHSFEGLPAHALVSYQDSGGFLWLTDHEAHTALWKEGHLYPLPELHAPFLIHAIEAADGSVWAGTAGTDLFQFRKQRFALIPTAGSPELAPLLFRQRNGAFWAAGGDLLRLSSALKDPVVTPVRAAHKPESWVQFKALSETPAGDILVGSRAFEGIQELEQAAYRPYLPPGSLAGTVQTMLLASSGEQWIGTTAGLYRLHNPVGNKLIRLFSGSVHCLLEAGTGTVWAGTSDGPYRFTRDAVEPLIVDRPWHFGTVVAMKLRGQGFLWMATQEHGIVRYDGQGFRALGSGDGLPTDNIYSLEFDTNGDFWLGSDVGLIRVRGDSIARHLANSANKLQVSLLDDADGLPASTLDPLGDQGSLKLPNGWLWFATEKGIAQFDPATLFQEPTRAHTVLEEHAIDGSALESGQVVLEPRQSNLELHYTALGSDKPEQLSFRYRLVGYDAHWVEAKGRRVAYYSHLPPGSYAFEVQSAETDGAEWDQATGATTTVRVLTPFYRTGWMKALVLLACLLATAYVLLRRQRRAYQEQQMRQAFTHQLITTQETERKRIAHDLHDSVGQQLVLIRTLAMLPRRDGGTGVDHLGAIAEQAAMAIKEVETISYDLRPYQLDRLGLTKAISSFIESFKQISTAIVVDCHMENIDDFFPKDLSINLYRIVQEVLSNVLKHAGATKVRVSLTRSPHLVRLLIADDGRGFGAAAVENDRSRLGLIGIRERAEALGGRAFIESTQGGGTTVTIEVARAGRSEDEVHYGALQRSAGEGPDSR